MKPQKKIPLFRPSLPDPDRWLPWYASAIETGQLTNFGPIHDACVKNLEAMHGGHWLLTCNGTVAIEAALSALPLDAINVAVPDFTFAATAQAVLRTGRTPVLVPCGRDMGMYPGLFYDNASRLDAALLVSPFGYTVPSHYEIAAMFKKAGRPVIWDNAGAYPEFDLEATTCFSLHAAKTLPIGEGGMVRFVDERARDHARRIISFDFDDQKSTLSPFGFNGKLDELHCAVLLAQLARQEKIMGKITKRIIQIRAYERALEKFCDPWPTEAVSGSPSICVLRLPRPDDIVAEGARRGITFRRYYHPFLSEMKGFEDLPRITGSNHASLRNCIALPSDVTHSEFEAVVECVIDVLNSPPEGCDEVKSN